MLPFILLFRSARKARRCHVTSHAGALPHLACFSPIAQTDNQPGLHSYNISHKNIASSMPKSSRRSIAIAPDGGKADQRHQFQDDLVACAHRQLLFLTLLHSQGISIPRPKVASLRRYIHLWLPLVAKHNNPSNDDDNDDAVELIPPADVAWLWHVHRLAPSQYKHHIRSTGLVDSKEGYLDANPPFSLQFVGIHVAGSELDGGTGPSANTESLFDEFDIEAPSAAFSSTEKSTPESVTRELWRKEYPSEQFFLEDCDRECTASLTDELDGDDEALVSGYDLLSAAERQSSFLCQVSRSCFRQDKFLREGVDRYHKFLLLWKSATKIHSLIPTYQIDVIWNSHMLSSTKKYDEDCKELIGCEFDHDDSLDDRSEESSEFIAFHATKSLWERTCKCPQIGDAFCIHVLHVLYLDARIARPSAL